MNEYFISVIIPTFNSSATINRAINSVLNQTILPLEIILIDDCSSDQTVQLIYEFSQKNDTEVRFIVLKNEKNCGPSYTRNKGISHSTGNWIAFLDSDDFWHPQKLEIQIQSSRETGMNFIGSKSVIETNIQSHVHLKSISNQNIKPVDMLWKNYFQTPTVFIKKTNDLTFDEKMSHAEDFDLWMRMIHKHQGAYLITLPLTYLGKEPYLSSGLSQNLLKMEMGELSVLMREKNIFLREAALLFSLLKFARRVIRTKLHALKKLSLKSR